MGNAHLLLHFGHEGEMGSPPWISAAQSSEICFFRRGGGVKSGLPGPNFF